MSQETIACCKVHGSLRSRFLTFVAVFSPSLHEPKCLRNSTASRPPLRNSAPCSRGTRASFDVGPEIPFWSAAGFWTSFGRCPMRRRSPRNLAGAARDRSDA
jgi:hypothetical protein